MELKFRVQSRSASKKRWNEKWKIRLSAGEEFHVTDQLLKLKGVDPTIVCAFYVQDGSLYFQMRDDEFNAIVNGVSRRDAVVGKGDRIAIGELAEIQVLVAPNASKTEPTLTDVGGEESDGPTLAMEPAESSSGGVSADKEIDTSPGVIEAGMEEIPDIAEPTTFLDARKKPAPLRAAPKREEKVEEPETTGTADFDPDAIPDLDVAEPREEMSKAGLRSLLESTRTQARRSIEEDPDKTPPMGIAKPEDLPFDYAAEDLQSVSDEGRTMGRKTQAAERGPLDPTQTVTQGKTKATQQFTKTVLQNQNDIKTKSQITTSYPLAGKEEKIELENTGTTDLGIQDDVKTGYHQAPKRDPKAAQKKKKGGDEDENEITKTLTKIGEKVADFTGAIAERLSAISSIVGRSKPAEKRKAGWDQVELTGTDTRFAKDQDDVTGDGIVVSKVPRPHPTQVLGADIVEKKKRRKFPTKALFFLTGLSLSIFAFFLVWVLLKPTPQTPIQIIRTNGTAPVVIAVNGVQPGSVGTIQVTQQNGGQSGAAGAPSAVGTAPPAPVRSATTQPPTTVTTRTPPQTQALSGAQAQGNRPVTPATPVSAPARVSPPVTPPPPSQESLPRGIPIEELVRKVQRLKAPPSSSVSNRLDTQGSSR